MIEFFDKVSASLFAANNGSYVKGVWSPNYSTIGTDVKIIAPQPANANDLQMLEEGERVLNHLKTWIQESVLPRQGAKDSAKIVYDSRTYLVVKTNDRLIDGGFYKIILKEITEDESEHRI